jgi:putative tryptophan/tyrosine transport system substrate-binding protein
VRRREFIAGLGSALAWPLIASAQQTSVPVVGSLHGITATQGADRIAAFRKGLAEMSFIEGRNVLIEYRWAEGQVERLPALAGDLF